MLPGFAGLFLCVEGLLMIVFFCGILDEEIHGCVAMSKGRLGGYFYAERKQQMQTNNQFTRTELLLGHDALETLKHSHVAVFGIGGVGSFAAEALVRCGVFNLTFVDSDVVNVTNINRQLVATHETLGQKKVDIMKKRALEINPNARIETIDVFYEPGNAGEFELGAYDYIVDAIDSVRSKLELIVRAKQAGVNIISSMGAGNKLEPARLEVADINRTSVCPLARRMRKSLRERGVDSLKVVYSKEPPVQHDGGVTASTPFVPPVAGFILASEVVRDLIATSHRP